jgi:hypothetical protein
MPLPCHQTRIDCLSNVHNTKRAMESAPLPQKGLGDEIIKETTKGVLIGVQKLIIAGADKDTVDRNTVLTAL